MLNSYDEGHGVGVDMNCVDITMSWEPLLSLQDKYVNQMGGDWEEVTTTWKRNSTFFQVISIKKISKAYDICDVSS